VLRNSSIGVQPSKLTNQPSSYGHSTESKKEETIEERIRRIRNKNNPQPPQDENQRVPMQKMNSVMGMQSSKTMLQGTQMQHALSLTGGQGGVRHADQSWISDQTNISFARNQQQQFSQSSHQGKALPSSKSTTADTGEHLQSQQRLGQDPYFNQQLGPMRGVNPDSNVNLQNDMLLLEQKRDKCVEIIKNSGAIHELLGRYKHDESMQAYNLDVGYMVQLLFQDRHFTNLLIQQLGRKQSANKLEKFIAEKLQEKLKAMQLEQQIKARMDGVALRLQQRLQRLSERL